MTIDGLIGPAIVDFCSKLLIRQHKHFTIEALVHLTMLECEPIKPYKQLDDITHAPRLPREKLLLKRAKL
jgi:hypothetical protein